jgi:AhpD family alkylhydroperoxidase
MLKLEGYIKQLGLDDRLYELIKIRASQINGCAYCLDMHTKDARAMGETEQRIYMLNACREAPFYTEAERAVMAGSYEDIRRRSASGYCMNTINCWNRISISTAMIPGEYEPANHK